MILSLPTISSSSRPAICTIPKPYPPDVERLGEEMIERAIPIAESILKEHWPEVERIASLLVKHKTIAMDKLQPEKKE